MLTHSKVEGYLSAFLLDVGEEASLFVRCELVSERGCGSAGKPVGRKAQQS